MTAWLFRIVAHFTQPIGHQGAARADYIADSICQPYSGGYLHAAAYLFYFGSDIVLFQIIAEKSRVTGSNLFVIEIFRTCEGFFLWYCEAQPAMCKTKLFKDCNILVFFENHVLAEDPDIGHLLFDILGDIIVP